MQIKTELVAGDAAHSGLKNAFCITDESAGGKTVIFHCRSADDRDRWIAAFASERRMARSQEDIDLDLDGLRQSICRQDCSKCHLHERCQCI
jgi:hypothetical protein